MMKSTVTLMWSLAMLLLTSNSAYAWMRFQYEDATVVERSDLIVVAHLKRNTIDPNASRQPSGAVLVITTVLKGECDEEEIPIGFGRGLTPVKRTGLNDSHRHSIHIYDSGNSIGGLPSRVEDALQDNLWFLRSHQIIDPEDVQPIALKDYVIAYMAHDPESEIAQHAKTNPEIAERAGRYLDHLKVQRVLELSDSQERYEKLLPFYLNGTRWSMKPEARDGIVACGKVAGDRLRQVFDDPEYSECRGDIIRMWREMGYREAVPILVTLLREHDAYWAKKNLEEGWWSGAAKSLQTRRQRKIYGEVYYAVCALRFLRDQRAADVLRMTRDRWRAIDFDNPQIVEECEAALRELPAGTGTDQGNG